MIWLFIFNSANFNIHLVFSLFSTSGCLEGNAEIIALVVSVIPITSGAIILILRRLSSSLSLKYFPFAYKFIFIILSETLNNQYLQHSTNTPKFYNESIKAE